MKVGVFGNFFPLSFRAGSATTGMVTLLARTPRISQITVFAPGGSTLPPSLSPAMVRVLNAWSPDRPFSLALCLLTMLRARRDLDLFLFSIYPTAFGRSPGANAAGLFLPSFLAKVSRVPVVVFMHNFLETQEVGKLGYRPGVFSRWVVRTLERWIVGSTTTIVPLRSMKETVEREVGSGVVVLPIPYVESIYSATISPPSNDVPGGPTGDAIQVLLFGTWGPQKNLKGAVETLISLISDGLPLQITIAGEVNPNFPAYQLWYNELLASLPPDRFRLLHQIPEGAVYPLVASADALLLPYRTTGGYSGVMNCAGLAGTPVIAYELPQLREFAEVLGLSAQFVTPGDASGVERSLKWAFSRSRARVSGERVPLADKLKGASDAIDRLLDLAGGPARKPKLPKNSC